MGGTGGGSKNRILGIYLKDIISRHPVAFVPWYITLIEAKILHAKCNDC